jgi:serine/threonine-protein kinase
MAVSTSCPRCSAPAAEGARFCLACGAALSASAEVVDDQILTRLRQATLGEYDVLRELGHGGMAAVYLAWDLELARYVAIKVLLPELAHRPTMSQRFLQEARTAANLDDHPSVVRVYRAKESGGLRYFVMKYVDGCSLEQLVRATGPLAPDLAAHVIDQVALALQYAHEHGVVHRDVKPGNVLLDRQGGVVVTDFGIAKVAEGDALTRTGFAIGTPHYMSPEQWRVEPLSPASDQYALGVVTYQLLTGVVPFDGTQYAIQEQHLHADPPPPAARQPAVPAAFGAVVQRMLAKPPAERFPDLRSVSRALADVPRESPLVLRERLARLIPAAVPSAMRAGTPQSPIPADSGPAFPPYTPHLRRPGSTAPERGWPGGEPLGSASTPPFDGGAPAAPAGAASMGDRPAPEPAYGASALFAPPAVLPVVPPAVAPPTPVPAVVAGAAPPDGVAPPPAGAGTPAEAAGVVTAPPAAAYTPSLAATALRPAASATPAPPDEPNVAVASTLDAAGDDALAVLDRPATAEAADAVGQVHARAPGETPPAPRRSRGRPGLLLGIVAAAAAAVAIVVARNREPAGVAGGSPRKEVVVDSPPSGASITQAEKPGDSVVPARPDSAALAQARQDSLEQAGRDSVERVRADSIARVLAGGKRSDSALVARKESIRRDSIARVRADPTPAAVVITADARPTAVTRVQTLVRGDSVRLAARVNNAGAVRLPQVPVRWTFGDPRLVTRRDTRWFVALAPGETTARAAAGAVYGEVRFVISPRPGDGKKEEGAAPPPLTEAAIAAAADELAALIRPGRADDLAARLAGSAVAGRPAADFVAWVRTAREVRARRVSVGLPSKERRPSVQSVMRIEWRDRGFGRGTVSRDVTFYVTLDHGGAGWHMDRATLPARFVP